jgi:glycosyltransferase involved in cell wall biosynthesis
MLKILCLTSHDMDGPDYGAALRARNLFRLLAQLGKVRIVLANPVDLGKELGNKKTSTGGFELAEVIGFQKTTRRPLTDRLRFEFDGRFLNTEWQQATAADRERLQRLMSGHDLVWIHGLKVANGFGLWRWPNSILDIDDIPSDFHRSDMAQAKGIIQKLRRYRQTYLWRRREKNILERFDALCVCSQADRKKLGGSDKIFVVPNGFGAPEKPSVRRPSIPPRIGFVGAFQYRPNREGMNWFVQQVWPQILRSIPQARLRLIGAGSENLQWPQDQNIDRLGFVQDVDSEMATWSLSIVPVFVGGGTRIKIAESFSRKCPIVSTTMGAHGYGAVDGREMFLADTVTDFSEKCLQILINPPIGKAMAEKGWQSFLENWTWDSFAGRVGEAVEYVLRRKIASHG